MKKNVTNILTLALKHPFHMSFNFNLLQINQQPVRNKNHNKSIQISFFFGVKIQIGLANKNW